MERKTYLYEVIEQECLCDDVSYIGYGIKLNAPSDGENIRGKVADGYSICDISTDRGKVVRLVSLFNKLKLDGCQFHDAVEDFMAAG